MSNNGNSNDNNARNNNPEQRDSASNWRALQYRLFLRQQMQHDIQNGSEPLANGSTVATTANWVNETRPRIESPARPASAATVSPSSASEPESATEAPINAAINELSQLSDEFESLVIQLLRHDTIRANETDDAINDGLAHAERLVRLMQMEEMLLRADQELVRRGFSLPSPRERSLQRFAFNAYENSVNSGNGFGYYAGNNNNNNNNGNDDDDDEGDDEVDDEGDNIDADVIDDGASDYDEENFVGQLRHDPNDLDNIIARTRALPRGAAAFATGNFSAIHNNFSDDDVAYAEAYADADADEDDAENVEDELAAQVMRMYHESGISQLRDANSHVSLPAILVGRRVVPRDETYEEEDAEISRRFDALLRGRTTGVTVGDARLPRTPPRVGRRNPGLETPASRTPAQTNSSSSSASTSTTTRSPAQLPNNIAFHGSSSKLKITPEQAGSVWMYRTPELRDGTIADITLRVLKGGCELTEASTV